MRITFVSYDGSAETIEAETNQSVMAAATANSIEGIEAVCGGGCSCATCHVFIDDAWITRLPPMHTEERVLIEFLDQRRPNSRLSCQIEMQAELDGLIVHLPEHQE